MLQVCNGKFLFTEDVYRTTHRAPLYTNLIFPDKKIDFCIGSIYPSSRFLPIVTIIAEIDECQPAKDSNGDQAIFIATTGSDLMNDLSAVISFYFGGFCTTSFSLAKQVLSDERIPGTANKLSDYIHRMFDKTIYINNKELDGFIEFIEKLVSLTRTDYIKVIKAIRRYVTAAIRISDDKDAAYALFVASIESLAQDFEEYETSWDDVEVRKKRALEKIFSQLEDNVSLSIKDVLVKHEHLALSRKFCGVVMNSLDMEFYSPVSEGFRVAGKDELTIAVKNAYNLRSKYVHELKHLPDELTTPFTLNYCCDIDEKPYLTFNGLSKVNKKVLLNFVSNAPSSGKENLPPHHYTPGMMVVKVSEIYWMWDPNIIKSGNYLMLFDAILTRIESCILSQKVEIPNMDNVVEEIGKKLLSENNRDNIFLLTGSLILLSNFFRITLNDRYAEPFKKHEVIYEDNHIISLLMHALWGNKLENPSVFNDIFKEYASKKFHKKSLKLSEFFESIICLHLIKSSEKDGDNTLRLELIDYIIFNTPNSPVRKKISTEKELEEVDIAYFFEINKKE